MRRLILFFLSGCMPVYILSAQQAKPAMEPPLQAGVTEALADYRCRVIAHPDYTLHFIIPAASTEPVMGSGEIRFQLKNRQQPLQIDFKGSAEQLKKLTVNGLSIPIRYEQEHLLIDTAYLQTGNNLVAVDFIAGNPSLNRNADFVYTLLVPDRARTVFPCFDQPSLKAVFRLSLTLPAGWQAIANGPIKDSVAGEGHTTFHFTASDTISTYLFAFAAGRFHLAVQQPQGRSMHFLFRETDSSKIKNSLAFIFNIQADALHFLENYTQIRYPFRKFDFVAIPDFQFGGMEHPGAIQYKASSLFLDDGATRDQLLARSNLLSHETAHMWFGDLVTMRWFNDVWMKEVFANFMADKISSITFKDNNYDLKFLTEHFPAAYNVDRTAGTHPIRQQLDNLQDAGALYGNIIYHKAPIMMRQLESLMGEQPFRDGLREYLEKYAYGNASWPDLISILDAHTPADLQAWNRVWVNEPGRPAFSYRMQAKNGKITKLGIMQQGEDGSPRIWPQLIELALIYPDHIDTLQVNADRAMVTLPAAASKAVPLAVLLNASGQGYGLFPADQQLLAQLPSLKNAVMRASAYISLYENMLSGRAVTPLQLLKTYCGLLTVEREELNLNLLLDQLSAVFWRFLSPAARLKQTPVVEQALWKALAQVPAGNAKKLLFKTYSGIALSRAAQDSLFTIWKTQQPPAGIRLAEDDYTALAAALAIRDYPGYEQVLQEQLSRIQNTDRRLRWQFLQPALSADTARRDAFFASLKLPANRQKEAWVVTALSYLHHPLRTAVSVKYLPESLSLVEEIQRTGDIFLPQNWLQATLGWYQDAKAAAMVRAFLNRHPAYPPRLKAKILQAADNLFRAEKLLRREE